MLQTPAAVRACYVRNSEGLTPIEVAQQYGNQGIVDILNNYTRKIKHIEQDLIRVSNTAVHFGYLSNNVAELSFPTKITTLPLKNIQRRKSFSVINNHQMHYSTTKKTTSKETKLTTEEQRKKRMVDAKDELLRLIDKFKAGLSIKTFEYLFHNWEEAYRDVLEAQISNEFQHSLNEIRKLCSDEDIDEDETEDIGLNGVRRPNYHNERSILANLSVLNY